MCVLITSQEDHKDNITKFLGSKGCWLFDDEACWRCQSTNVTTKRIQFSYHLVEIKKA
jgi:hypothetical protein